MEYWIKSQLNVVIIIVLLICTCTYGQTTTSKPTQLLTEVFTNLEPLGCPCQDNPPPKTEGITCEQQKQWGKCNEYWMLAGDFCSVTCDRCTCNQGTQIYSVPEGCTCSDIRPPGAELSCYHQRRFGKCPADWMIMPRLDATQGYCEYSCGRCSCPGAPDPRPTIPDTDGGPDGCQCSDVEPKGKPFNCKQQLKFGKCEAIWMFDGPVDEGFCQLTCGRCPCQPRSPPPPLLLNPPPPPPLQSPPPPSPPEQIILPLLREMTTPPSPPLQNFPVLVLSVTSENTINTENVSPIEEIGLVDATQIPQMEDNLTFIMEIEAEQIPQSEQNLTSIGVQNAPLQEPISEDFPFSVLPEDFPFLLSNQSPSPNAIGTLILPQQTTQTTFNGQIFSCEGEGCQTLAPPPPKNNSIQALSLECPPGQTCDIDAFSTVQKYQEEESSTISSTTCFPVFQIFEESNDMAFLSFTALLKNAGYGSFLTAPVIPLTLFAPTNDAIQKTADLIGISVEDLLNDLELVGKFARYHLLPAAFDLETLVISGGPFSTFEADGVLFFEQDDGTYDPSRTEYPSIEIFAKGNSAHVISSDLFGCGITVHIIDQLLLPFIPDPLAPPPPPPTPVLPPAPPPEPEKCLTVLELLKLRNDTLIFVRLIESVSDLANLFDNENFQATFFVPTDEGIEQVALEREIDIDVFFDEPGIIISLLSWSLVGQLVPTEVAINAQNVTYPTLLSTFGIKLQLNEDQSEWVVIGDGGNVANVTETNLQACKSIVHIMDRLLIPSVQFENIEDSAQTKSQNVTIESEQNLDQNRTIKLTSEKDKNQTSDQVLLLSDQSMQKIMTDLLKLIAKVEVASEPAQEVLTNIETLFEMENVQSSQDWLEMLTKQLGKIGLSKKQIRAFQRKALEHMEGAEPVQAYRSAVATHNFNSTKIPGEVLSQEVLQQVGWNVSDNPDNAVSRVYVAMYESVTTEEDQEQFQWTANKNQSIGSENVATSAQIIGDIFGDNTDCTKTVIDVLSERLELSTMYKIVQSFAKGPLSNPNLGVTLFAPHNQAFQLLFTASNQTLDELIQEQSTLIALLGTLTVPDKLNSDQLYQISEIFALDGSALYIERETVLDFYGRPRESLSVETGRYRGYVTQGDIDACRSIVHVMDKVLIPNSVEQKLIS